MHPAAKTVEEYLRLLMIPDPDAARHYIGAELEIRFTGNRLMRDPAECAAFNAKRYKWVKKSFEALRTMRRTHSDSSGSSAGKSPPGGSQSM